MATILIDTNILVYTHDRASSRKQEQASRLLDALYNRGIAFLSVQTLGEFFRVVTRGKHPMVSVEEAYLELQDMNAGWDILELTPAIVMEAARGVRDHQLAYWDSQIWATAKLNQIPVVFTEDFPSAPIIEGVQFVNPFASNFVLDDWL